MGTAAKQQLSPKTVLVVDDNASVRKTLCAMFLADGFDSCTEAENGKQALEVAKQCSPTIIILDLVMPIMNGLDAAPLLKKITPHTLIILFSLHAEFLKKEKLAASGIDAVFLKGNPVSELLQKAHQLIDATYPQL